jgi:hypothetical protein
MSREKELYRATKRLLDATRSDAWQKFVTDELTSNTTVCKVHQVIRSALMAGAPTRNQLK